ncbi:hypothetical protein [Kribbella speibonae]|uniref:Uncharacterized protein n=1 Tax=Kribbella speibonae TaxID=1572660 RepID=A0A4R0J3T9_9ACTN|nr:hypothetical protein [Kribbella speibonae]TCC38896.1 hypothetical protein E0H92_21255 [Kribbella speibonae]
MNPPLSTPGARSGDSRPQASTPHLLRAIGWANPHLLSAGPRYLAQLGIGACIVLLSILDAYLMQGPLQSVLRHDPSTTLRIALGVSAASALFAAWVGYTLKGANGEHPGNRRYLVLPAVMGLMWLAVGLCIFAIRIVSGSTRAAVTYDGAAPTASTPGISAATWASAALFLAVYFLVGLAAFGDVYHQRNDAAASLRRTARKLATTRQKLQADEALLRRLVEGLGIRQLEVELLPRQVERAKTGHLAHALALRQLSRHEQAIHLASPSGTGITSPDHEKNPANTGSGVTQPPA